MRLYDCANVGAEFGWGNPRPESGQGGIYAIINRENGRVYIGCTRLPFRYRWYAHYLGMIREGDWTGTSRYLRVDWDRFGPDVFDVMDLESVTDERKLRQKEREWIETMRACHFPLYNCDRWHPPKLS